MWSEIKSIIQDNKTRCVIIEEGKPLYVVLPFDEYQQLQKNGARSTIEHANHELQEIWELGEQDLTPEKKVAPISIEDLPF